MIKEYIKETGLVNFTDLYDADFLDWLDRRALNWFKQHYGEEGEDERKEMYRVIERYVVENGWDFEEEDGDKID